jgi:hypothetical protein
MKERSSIDCCRWNRAAICYPSAPLRAGGKSFQHFTTKNGLGSNSALHIYEDKAGNIWFATGGDMKPS